MKHRIAGSLFVTVLSVLLLAASAFASDAPSEFVASLSWVDSTESHARDISASGSLTFPIFDYFSVGPVLDYRSIRFEQDRSEPAPVPPVIETETAEPPVPTPTAETAPVDDDANIWSVGGRAVLYTTPTHNGIYFAAEALFPRGDSEGQVWTAEGGFQSIFGDGQGVDGLLRVAYERSYHRDEGEFRDLGSQQVTVGFGLSF